MELTVTVTPEETLIKLRGRFDAHETVEFRSTVPGPRAGIPIVVDLSDVVFIDSTALAELVRLSRAASQGDSRLVLRNLSVPVRVILELTGLDRALTVESAAAPAS